ncbi:hypothetical protein D3C87_80140 [compost metagenome]
MRFERMMKNIRFDLFDVSRLMVGDNMKLKIFHNEITLICNEILLELEKQTSFATDSDQEKRIVYELLGYEKTKTTDFESLYDKCYELIHFTYETFGKDSNLNYRNRQIIDGFLKRVKRTIKLNVDEKYKLPDGVLQETNATSNIVRYMGIGSEGVIHSIGPKF